MRRYRLKYIVLTLSLSFLFSFSGAQTIVKDYVLSSIDQNKDPIDQALEAIGLTRETCAFPLSSAAVASDKQFESPVYRNLLYRPFEIPYYLGHVEYNFDCYRDQLVRTLIFQSSRAGISVARGYFTKPLAGLETRLERAESPLALALEEIYALSNSRLGEGDLDALTSAVKDIPPLVRFEAARLLLTAAQAVRWQQKAFHPVQKSDHRYLLDDVPKRLTPPLQKSNDISTITEQWERDVQSDLRPLIGLVDYQYLLCGALDLLSSIEKAWHNLSKMEVKQKFDFEINTPLGWVILNGAGESNSYRGDREYLLIMDFGGDDTYQGGGGSSSFSKPISILLDFEGDDSYVQTLSGLRPAFGAGILGYGFLFDFKGNDRYVCPQLSQGSAYFGVGWLVDYQGNDTYESIRFAQGFARGGVGFLYDRLGNDVYYSFNSSQGCGETRGCGMLVDEDGDDEYLLNDTDIKFPSAQTAKHNRSIGQGIGVGERADEKDGHSLPGGIGILMDKKGNDKYSAGVFAQGTGFWDGVGILIDSSGNDSFSGAWYVQGVGIHGGIGALCDRDGNDTYTATLHASQGIGHDNAIGVFVEEKGNDVYHSPRLSLGTANENSLGFFFELGGNDEYRVPFSEALGRAQFSKWGTLREDYLNVGLFVDAGGQDLYKTPHGMNNQKWVQIPSRDLSLKSELGIGLDGDFSKVNLRLRPLTQKPLNVDW